MEQSLCKSNSTYSLYNSGKSWGVGHKDILITVWPIQLNTPKEPDEQVETCTFLQNLIPKDSSSPRCWAVSTGTSTDESEFMVSLTLGMEAVHSSETLVTIYQSKRIEKVLQPRRVESSASHQVREIVYSNRSSKGMRPTLNGISLSRTQPILRQQTWLTSESQDHLSS